MSITIPLIATDGATSTVTLPDPIINQPVGVNLLQSSDDFTQAVWQKTGVIISHSTDPAPDGTLTTIKVTEDTSNGYHAVQQIFANSGTNQYTFKFQAKANGRSIVAGFWDSATNSGAWALFFIYAGGSIGSPNVAGTGYKIISTSIQQDTSDQNGFYSCEITAQIISNSSNVWAYYQILDSTNSVTYTGTGISGFEVAEISLVINPPLPSMTGTFYVSANGNDAANGTSNTTPWKTISKVNSFIYAPGSQILFRGGDTFIGNLIPQIANGTKTNPVVFGSYGSGRAIINPSTGGLGSGIINLDGGIVGITIQDLILSAPDTTVQPTGGIRIGNNTDLVSSDWIIQRCDISGIRYNAYGSPSNFGAEIKVELWPAGSAGSGSTATCQINNVTIKNCDLHGLSGVNSFDDAGITGWGGQPANGWLFVGNLVYNIGSPGALSTNNGTVFPPIGNGIHTNGISNSLMKYNIVHDMAANFNNGGAGPVCFTTNGCTNVTIRFNEGYRMRPIARPDMVIDFTGVDFDTSTSNSLCEFNFMHGNWNSGYINFCAGESDWDNNTIRYNLGYNNCENGCPGFGEIASSPGWNSTVHVYNNKTYNNRAFHGALYQSQQQYAPCLTHGNVGGGNANSTYSNNIQIEAQISNDGYTWSPFVWRPYQGGTQTNLSQIQNNHWYQELSGTTMIIWWDATMYNDIASWQAVAGIGKSGNMVTTGSPGPNIFATTATLGLSSGECTTAIAALQAVQTIPGIDSGTSDYGASLPGSRMASLITRFQAGDSPITLPEYTVLGFALTRADTTASNALLARIEPIAMTAFQV